MSRSYQSYMNDVLEEIERVIEARRNAPKLHRVPRQLFSNASISLKSSASSSGDADGAGTAQTDESSLANNLKIHVRDEVQRLNSKTEAISAESLAEIKSENLFDKRATDDIEIIANDSDSEGDRVAACSTVSKFTIGSESASDGEEDADQATNDHGDEDEDTCQIQVEEPGDLLQAEEPARRRTDRMIYVYLIFMAILAFGIFAVCVYNGIMASQH